MWSTNFDFLSVLYTVRYINSQAVSILSGGLQSLHNWDIDTTLKILAWIHAGHFKFNKVWYQQLVHHVFKSISVHFLLVYIFHFAFVNYLIYSSLFFFWRFANAPRLKRLCPVLLFYLFTGQQVFSTKINNQNVFVLSPEYVYKKCEMLIKILAHIALLISVNLNG